MDTTETHLSERWQELTHRMGWSAPGVDEVGADLVDRYREPHRRYHGTDHLLAVLTALDDLSGPHAPPVTVVLAAWFHDAIYEGIPTADETASAELARGMLAASPLPAPDRERVAEMVLATARHMDPAARHDPDTALLLDADLSVLGAPPDTYDAYSLGVRAEHPGIDDEQFRRGRLAVVEALSARPALFLTPAGVNRYEAAARANLRRERLALIAAAPPP